MLVFGKVRHGFTNPAQAEFGQPDMRGQRYTVLSQPGKIPPYSRVLYATNKVPQEGDSSIHDFVGRARSALRLGHWHLWLIAMAQLAPAWLVRRYMGC